MLNGSTTYSPTCTLSTPSPTSTTRPRFSCPNQRPVSKVGPSLVHVQVGAADVRRRDPHQDVGRPLDPRVRHILDTDLPRPLVDHCLHAVSLVAGVPHRSGVGSGPDCTRRSEGPGIGRHADTGAERPGPATGTGRPATVAGIGRPAEGRNAHRPLP